MWQDDVFRNDANSSDGAELSIISHTHPHTLSLTQPCLLVSLRFPGGKVPKPCQRLRGVLCDRGAINLAWV